MWFRVRVVGLRRGRGVQIFGRLVGVVDEGRLQGACAAGVPSLIAEGVVGAVLRFLSAVGDWWGESLVGCWMR